MRPYRRRGPPRYRLRPARCRAPAGLRGRRGSRRPQLALTPGVGREREGHRSVRLEAHQHRGAEPALKDLETAAAERSAEPLEEPFSELRRGGRREVGSAAMTSVAVQRELRDGEHRAADVRERALHLAGLFENAKAGDLRGEAFAVLRTVVRADAEEDDDTGF